MFDTAPAKAVCAVAGPKLAMSPRAATKAAEATKVVAATIASAAMEQAIIALAQGVPAHVEMHAVSVSASDLVGGAADLTGLDTVHAVAVEVVRCLTDAVVARLSLNE